MQIAVKKWGNSAAVRIPASILEAAQLSLDQSVDIREQDGRIIIEPVRPADCDLAALIKAISQDNRQPEIGFGAPVGAEML